ncbi:MAG: sugar phosphate isomerase/epimerase family protein [Flavobacterium sp.]
MNISYLCPHWGSEDKTATAFLNSVVAEGYDGIEINLPADENFVQELRHGIDGIRTEREFKVVGQCVPDAKVESVDEHIARVTGCLERVLDFWPDFVNSHTGKDYFSFDDNCRIIDAVENVAAQKGITLMHETHRGRFSYHACQLLPYLEKFPQMKLVADFSHFCAVSESMLEGQCKAIQKIISHVGHIHARVGYEQGPQVNDPFAPEWKNHLETFRGWWQDMLHYHKMQGQSIFTITTEAGPAPYMPTLPFTGEPVSSQWRINAKMKDYLKINMV